MSRDLPEIIDLFSGCGGLALGFRKAGFNVRYGADITPAAIETASYNLSWRFGDESRHVCADLTTVQPEEIVTANNSSGYIVIGGPPCQAYSNIGVNKLRSLGPHREQSKDARGYLFEDFVRLAVGIRARAIVMENVPDATSYCGFNVPSRVCEMLAKDGYEAYWTMLNSADYGVPQTRERVFVVAIHTSECKHVDLPIPTHRNPAGTPTQNDLRFKAFTNDPFYRPAVAASTEVSPWVTVDEAISDLPSLLPSESSVYRLYRMNTVLPYATGPVSQYQRLMRSWYGTDSLGVTGNGIRKTLRDFPIFSRMDEGDDYVAASRIADKLLRDACYAKRIPEDENNAEYIKLKAAIVPPYDRDNFKSKWQRLRRDTPSHTITAHLAVDTYSHIHPTEPRGISVREAARLQSFPDGFLFQGSMGDAFRQIGNAVPPLLASAIAQKVRDALTS